MKRIAFLIALFCTTYSAHASDPQDYYYDEAAARCCCMSTTLCILGGSGIGSLWGGPPLGLLGAIAGGVFGSMISDAACPRIKCRTKKD
jgi:hypothetical protein